MTPTMCYPKFPLRIDAIAVSSWDPMTRRSVALEKRKKAVQDQQRPYGTSRFRTLPMYYLKQVVECHGRPYEEWGYEPDEPEEPETSKPEEITNPDEQWEEKEDEW
ncbi:hypothetical protein [Synechococcus sp. PCC 6312]|uniref:hypothetical protein n=1 Tax=Synechococcus sp. (strain ATCC 27167 / PCC 6312) TaxID=195253 RepID=UPI0012EA2EA3|nr:hypothetical protein [Synechococcus sp. PCC 6312]